MEHLRYNPATHTKPVQAVRFGGYQLTPEGKARLFLPGCYSDAADEFRYRAYAKVLDGDKAQDLELVPQGHYWVSKEALPLGTNYRFRVEESYGKGSRDVLENLQVKEINGEKYNVISPFEATAPRKSVVMADIFLDSVVSRKKLAEWLERYGKGDLASTVRTHFNQFGGDELGLKEVMPILEQAGFTGILLKPFIGGDNLSSHRYWTTDPYVLNSSFSSKQAFREFLSDSLKGGFKVFSDGAFVNLGLNAPQFWSNLHDGFRSPYWDWFVYDLSDQHGIKQPYPKEAYGKHQLPILPSKFNPQSGLSTTDYDSIDYRILNDPDQPGYDARRPIFIEYIPRPNDAKILLTNEDSVQRYQFRIDAKELRKKRELAQDVTDRDQKKQLFLEWNKFSLVPASKGGMPVKWDGQNDVLKLNMKNPEVQEYIRGAMSYWTRFAQRAGVTEVTRALSEARAKHPDGTPLQWLEAITRNSETEQNRLLPKILFPDLDTMTAEDVKAAQKRSDSLVDGGLEQALVETLREEFPLMALNIPSHFKSTLAHPKLAKELQQEPLPLVVQVCKWLFYPVWKPLSFLEPVHSLLEQLEELFLPKSFEKILAGKLQEAVKALPEESRSKLGRQVIQPLVGEDLGQALYLQLLTNQSSPDPKAIEDGFYNTVDPEIIHADPDTAKNLLVRFMKKRLKALDPNRLADVLANKLHDLDPQMAALAECVLNKRELGGMNWRADAAKDVGDFVKVQDVRNPLVRVKLFNQEIEFVRSFWEQVTGSLRKIYPKTSLIAELTDFEKLSSEEAATEAYQKLFDSNIFTSMPNMRYMYNTPTRLVHYAPRPDEFGDQQMKPSQFLAGVKAMSQSVPFPVLRQFQNLTASHDYPTTAHALLINPCIATMDYLKWWGVKDDLVEAVTELRTKPGFRQQRERLAAMGITNLDDVLQKMMLRVSEPAFFEALPPDIQEYYSESQKKLTRVDGSVEWIGPNPVQIKHHLVQSLFSLSTPDQLGLTGLKSPEAVKVLEESIVERITEPSEARAMRAVLSNTLSRLDWGAVTRRLDVSPEVAQVVRDRVNQLMPDAFAKTIAKYGRHWGNRPLEIALDNVFESFPAGWDVNLAGNTPPARVQTAVREQMYEQALMPVLEKLKKIIALQVAVPGNPSVYLPDLFAQSGSELVKNIFVQNRNLIRYDYLDDLSGDALKKISDKPYLRSFFKDVSEILKLRSRYQALNDGVVLDVAVNDNDHVVPVVRDNGKDQVIMLVHTGQPSDVGWDKVGDGPLYKEIALNQNKKNGFKLDAASFMHLDRNARYVDPENGEEFHLNGNGQLVKAGTSEDGIDISRSYRILIRQ